MSESKPEYAAPNWQQINATVYQLSDDGAGHQVNRFSFNVQSNNRMLKPGEDEQIASLILREHNSHAALVEAVRHALAIETSTTMAEERKLRGQAKAIYKAALALAKKEI